MPPPGGAGVGVGIAGEAVGAAGTAVGSGRGVGRGVLAEVGVVNGAASLKAGVALEVSGCGEHPPA